MSSTRVIGFTTLSWDSVGEGLKKLGVSFGITNLFMAGDDVDQCTPLRVYHVDLSETV